MSEIRDFIPLFDHAKTTADKLGHPHRLSRKEWDESNALHASSEVVLRFGTWKKFIDNVLIDAESRAYERRMDRISELLDPCLDQLIAEKLIEERDRDQIWFDLTGVR